MITETNVPTGQPHKVYLAGKIAKLDWRHSIFPGLNRENDLVRNGLEYCGPFFLACDHGCCHGPGTHARGEGCGSGEGTGYDGPNPERPDRVAKLCKEWIDACDVVFCYLDNDRAFGTIFELGYAVAKGKPIFIAIEADDKSQDRNGELFDFVRFWKDAWFLRYSVNRFIGAPDAISAWEFFVKWYWYKHAAYESRRESTVEIARRNGK
jgi:hypothetical protein